MPKPVQKVVPPKQTETSAQVPVQKVIPSQQAGKEPIQTVSPVKKTEMKFISPLKENYEFKIGESARWKYLIKLKIEIKNINNNFFRIKTQISESVQAPVFKWFCNGIQIKSNEKIQVLNERYTSTLNIINVQHTDSGRYDCLVENSSGQQLLKSSTSIKISG